MDHEPQWESLIGSQNSIRAQSIDDTESAMNDTDDLLVSNNPASLANLAPLSSTSEVTLDKFPLN